MTDEADGPIRLPFRIGISPTLGIRGLIATQPISPGAVIERCPIILVPKREEAALAKTVLWKYYYEWNGRSHCIVLGYGSLINHSYTPNARYGHNYRTKRLVYSALRAIRPGEEITVNYNFDPDDRDPVEPFLVDFNRHKPD